MVSCASASSAGITITAGPIRRVAVLGLATGTTASDVGNWLVHLVRSS